jgi:hypothetical protein
MRKEALKETTAQRAENNQQRLSPGEKRNFKRIAAVASVYLVKRFKRAPEEIIEELIEQQTKSRKKRSKPIEKRVRASLEDSFKTVVSEMFFELKRRTLSDNTNGWLWLMAIGNK